MTDDNQEVQPEQSLEDIAAQFEMPNEPQKQPEQSPTPALDGVEKLSQQLSQVQQRLDAEDARRAQEAERADIESAVQAIKGVASEADEKLIKGMLYAEYGENEAFRKIFDNRHQNSKAYNDALSLVGKAVKEAAAITVDPQVAENERALHQSIKNQSSYEPSDIPEEHRNMSDEAAFAMMQKMAQGA